MSLKIVLRNYLFDQLTDPQTDGWVHKGNILRAVSENGYMGDTVGRRLRELEDEKFIISRKAGKSLEYKYANEVPKPLPDDVLETDNWWDK